MQFSLRRIMLRADAMIILLNEDIKEGTLVKLVKNLNSKDSSENPNCIVNLTKSIFQYFFSNPGVAG